MVLANYSQIQTAKALINNTSRLLTSRNLCQVKAGRSFSILHLNKIEVSRVKKLKNVAPFNSLLFRRVSNQQRENVFLKKFGHSLKVFVGGAVVLAGMFKVHDVYQQYTSNISDGTSTEVHSTGQMEVGGDWKLTDMHGKPISSDDFLGEWYFLYFGFCHCPDICPEELEKVSEVMDEFATRSDVPNLKTLFITVDPWRDTPEVMKKYCEEFHKDLMGVTGSVEEIKTATKKFRLYISKGPVDEDGDYIVDHSIFTFLMNPLGRPEHYYSNTKLKEFMITDITQRIKKWEKINGTTKAKNSKTSHA